MKNFSFLRHGQKGIYKQYLLFFFTLALFLFYSCNDKDEIKSPKDYNQPLALIVAQNSINFENLESELLDFWEAGLEEYSLEIFCSCDCEGVIAAQAMLNDKNDLLPSLFFNYSNMTLSCSELKDFLSQDCNYSNKEDYFQFISETIKPTAHIIQEEVDLILDLLEDIKSNESNVDYPSYRQRWDNLTGQSEVNNLYSALVIEVANAAGIFVPAFIETVPGDEPPQPIWNKVAGAAIGGFLGYMIEGAAQGSDFYSAEEAGDAFIKGAIGGAIRSL